MRYWILGSMALLLAGCGASKPSLETGQGLYRAYTDERLEAEGYPGSSPDSYSSMEWGVLYDDDGIPYGPRSFYDGRQMVDHPYLELTEEHLQSRWVRVPRSECCTEPLLGHYLEICDLAWVDITTQLGYRPTQRINVYSPDDMDDFYRVTGADFAQSFVVSGHSVVVQPIDVLFRRTLAGHVAFAAVGEALIAMQTHGAAPPWLQTGLASYFAQEGFEHLSFMNEFRARRESILLTPAEVDAGLVPFTSRETGRIARYNAFLMAWHLCERHGLDRVVQLLQAMEQGARFDEAVPMVYGVDASALLAAIDPTVLGEPTTTMPGR